MAQQTNKQTLQEYGRGVIGGLLFSLPLLYTMEVWWNGFTAPPGYLLSCVIITYLLLLGYNRYAGMKKDTSFKEICWESVEEIGLGFILSFLFLLLTSRIELSMSIDEIAGKVIVEAMIVAIGISVGTAQLGGNAKEESEGGNSNSEEEEKESPSKRTESGRNSGFLKTASNQEKESLSDTKSGNEGARDEKEDGGNLKRVILSLCGAVLFASSVAPTEEILMIAVEAEAVELLLMVLVSLILGGIIVYFSEFRGASGSETSKFTMVLDLSVMYAIALLVSFGFLWFFGRLQDYSLEIVVAQLVVLGIPAALGASAGRFLISG